MLKFTKIEDPGLKLMVSELFAKHAPLTTALKAAGLVLEVDEEHAVSQAVLKVHQLSDSGADDARYTIKHIPLHLITANVPDQHDMGGLKKAIIAVAEAVEKNVKEQLAQCRVIIGLKPCVVKWDTAQQPRGVKVAAVITAEARPLPPPITTLRG